MDKGTIIEFGSPSSLLADQQSTFFSMCKDAGIVSWGCELDNVILIVVCVYLVPYEHYTEDN